MHQVFLAIAVASYKIGPIMSSLQEQKQNNTLQEKGKKTLLTTKGATLKEQLQRLEEISQVSNQESLQQLQSFFHSFNDDDESMILLREQLGVVALEAQLLRDPLYNRTQSTALLRLSSSPSSSSSLPPSAQEQLD
ncbi:hypothetical protein BGX31_005240 [Mortierella sp. GBA43]|nr:hypothetical protein BGX31_005240 [Mortierella sp. GBA43]